VNVIPGEVQLSLDIRGPQDAPLDRLLAELLEHAQAIASRRGLVQRRGVLPHRRHAVRYPPAKRAGEAVESVQGRSLSLPSGAGHDAIAIAERWPVGMLFVRCKGASATIRRNR
jgi:allantoate deiminase